MTPLDMPKTPSPRRYGKAIVSHYPRGVVQAALDVVKPLLADHCEILTPAGSYRRGLAQCRDLDLVAVPSQIQQQGDMFGGGKTATRSTLTDRLAELRDASIGSITFRPRQLAGQIDGQARRPHGAVLADARHSGDRRAVSNDDAELDVLKRRRPPWSRSTSTSCCRRRPTP